MMIDLESQMEWGDQPSLITFWGDHAFAHGSYARSISSALPVFDVADQLALAEFALKMTKDGKNAATESLDAWLIKHNSLHVAELNALNISATFDLSTRDFSEQGQFATWMETHARLHVAQDRKLGL